MAAEENTVNYSSTVLASSSAPCWYAIYTKPAKEDLAVEYISRLGLEAFNPKIKKSQKVWGVLREINAPLFPCYVFARFSEFYMHSVRYARGVRRIVGTGEIPTPIDERIIDCIRSRSVEEQSYGKSSAIKPGDTVVINCGLFYGLEGIVLEELNDKERVRILLNTIEWQARVLVEKRRIEKTAR